MTAETTLTSSPITHFISPCSPQWHTRLEWRHIPFEPVPLFCPLWAFNFNPPSAPFSSVPLYPPQEECPLQLSTSILHFFSLIIWAGIELHLGPIRDPCSVGGSRVYAGWVAFICTVCNQWCHHGCTGIHSTADYLRLAPWSCPKCSTPAPPAAPTREEESSDMEQTHSTLSYGDSLSQ